jgi:hypothetical protein
MADLVDGAVATGAGAFQPGQQNTRSLSLPWHEDLPEDDDGNFPLDPALKGDGGRFIPPTASPVPGSDADSDMDDASPIPVRVLLISWPQ